MRALPNGIFSTKLIICEYHLIECVTKHRPAIFKIFSLGKDFRPLHKLPHVSGGNFGIFCGIVYHYPIDFFAKLQASGWHHTQYEAKEPVLVSRDKVHFVVTYSRRDKSGGILTMHKNLWIVTRVSGKWGIPCVRTDSSGG